MVWIICSCTHHHYSPVCGLVLCLLYSLAAAEAGDSSRGQQLQQLDSRPSAICTAVEKSDTSCVPAAAPLLKPFVPRLAAAPGDVLPVSAADVPPDPEQKVSEGTRSNAVQQLESAARIKHAIYWTAAAAVDVGGAADTFGMTAGSCISSKTQSFHHHEPLLAQCSIAWRHLPFPAAAPCACDAQHSRCFQRNARVAVQHIHLHVNVVSKVPCRSSASSATSTSSPQHV